MSENSTSTGSVNFDTNLVKADAMAHQQAANVAPERPRVVIGGIAPVAEVAVAEVAAEESFTEAPAAINTLSIIPIITLSYGNPYMMNLRELKTVSIPVDGATETFNFYNPFAKANPTKHSPEGLIRAVFAKIVGLINEVSNREVVYLGSADAFKSISSGVAAQLASNIEKELPLTPDVELFELEQVVDGKPVSICFGDLLSIKTWAACIFDEDSGTVKTSVYLNMIVNAGAFYDSEEPAVFVGRAKSFVRNILAKLDSSELDPCLAVAINSVGLQDELTRVLLDSLVSESGFDVLSKNKALNNEEDWLPPSEVSKVFVDNTDILLLGFINEDTETAADGE